MKKTHRLELEKIPGFVSDSGTLKLRIPAAEQVGRDYAALERQAYQQASSSSPADLFSQVAERQNQMLGELQPKVEEILKDPNDPRAKMMQQMLEMLGGLPAMHDVEAIRSDVANSDSVIQDPVQDHSIEVEIDDEEAAPTDSAAWLSENFERLIPGFVEAARYAYEMLADDPLNALEAGTYLVENPSDQDYLNRVQIQSVEIRTERRYVFSLETPCAHLDEHGMYAVFNEDTLVACGEYDVITELDDPGSAEDEDF